MSNTVKIILGGIFCLLVFGCVVLFGKFNTKSYEENIIKIKQQECLLRQQKQKILDDMTYTQSWSHTQGTYITEELIDIEKKLQNALSNVSECEGINYNGIDTGRSILNLIVPSAKADYEGKKISSEVIIVYNSIVHLGLSKDKAIHIAKECNGSKDRSHCYKFTVGIMNAETSMCKTANWKKNCFGIMKRPPPKYKRTVKSYKTHKDSISDFVEIYKRKRQGWIRTNQRVLPLGNYCTEGCDSREGNVQFAIDKMNLPLQNKKG